MARLERQFTGCPCGCLEEPCVTERAAPNGTACCQSLDFEALAACNREGLMCSPQRCARQLLEARRTW